MWGPPAEGTGKGRPRRGRKEPSVSSAEMHTSHYVSRAAGGANNGRQKGKGVGLVGSAGACGSPGVWSAGGALAALAVPCRTTFRHGIARVRQNG